MPTQNFQDWFVATPAAGDASYRIANTLFVRQVTVAIGQLATIAGLSVLGNASTASTGPAAIVGAGAQVLRVNDAGTTIGFGAVNLGSAAAVTGGLPLTNITTIPSLTILANLSTGASTVGSTSISNLIDNCIGSAQGQILYRNAATWVFLTPGTNGQLLQTQGAAANPRWIGGAVLLNTLSPNNIASTSDTSSLTSTYKDYLVTFENVCPATQTTTFQMQIATSGNAFTTAGYLSMASVAVNSVLIVDTSTSAILLSGVRATAQVATNTVYGVNGYIVISNPSNAAYRKNVIGQTEWMSPGTVGTATLAMGSVSGFNDIANAVTGINFLFSSGNVQTGTIRIFGLL